MSCKNFNMCTFGVLCIAIGIILVQGIQSQNIENNEIIEQIVHGVNVYHRDSRCALIGGDCVQNRDCLVPSTNRGLCPSNAHRGVECCFEIKLRPRLCQEHYGECMDRCHKTLLRPSTDCTDGQVCCVLV